MYSLQAPFVTDALVVLRELLAAGIEVDRIKLASGNGEWILEFAADVDLGEVQRAVRHIQPHILVRQVPAPKVAIPPRRVTLTLPARPDWRCEGLAYD